MPQIELKSALSLIDLRYAIQSVIDQGKFVTEGGRQPRMVKHGDSYTDGADIEEVDWSARGPEDRGYKYAGDVEDRKQ